MRDRTVHDAWVEVPLDLEWMAAYRLVAGTHGRPLVAEIRIFPRERSRDRQAGQWSAEALGVTAPIPPYGITAETIRKVRVGDHRAVGVQFARWHARNEASSKPGSKFGSKFTYSSLTARVHRTAVLPVLRRAKTLKGFVPEPLPIPQRGRPVVHDDRFFAQLAQDYARRVTEGNVTPTADIGEKRGVSVSRMRALLHEARKRGLLSPTSQGRAGGVVT